MQFAIDALAGYGLLCIAGQLILVLILCTDWRDRIRRRHRTHMASRCRYCNYTDRLDKVRLHETQDHSQ